MIKRKLLFLVFTNDSCKQNHAFMNALDLTEHGHEVRMVLEGEATRCLAVKEGRLAELLQSVKEKGIIAGACKAASAGCATSDPTRNVTVAAAEQKIPLLDDMGGHASLAGFVADGYELIVF